MMVVEDQQPGLVYQRPCDHEPPLHAARQAARDVVASIPEPQCSQVFLGSLPGEAAVQPIVTGLVQDDIANLFPLVDVEFLRYQADALLGGLELPVDVMGEDLDLARRLVDQ
jgi:hypothetical protein